MTTRAARTLSALAASAVLVVAPFGARADTPTPVATPSPKPAGCTAPPHRQFDFWIGDWDVADAKGKAAGRNRIVALHDGCVLQENWMGNGGFSGSSLNAYDTQRKSWHQTWVDNSGALLQLDGHFVDGRMVLTGESLDDGRRVLQRIAWQTLPDGRVRQLWESSADGGTTWTVAFDGYYTKR